jgi:hypothetical protein
MSYLSRLKQLACDEKFTDSPRPEPTELTKEGFGGFVSTVPGVYDNISANDSAAAASLKVGAGDTVEPFDREAFEERSAIAEFDGGLSRADAEALAWQEDDRRRCTQCLNLRQGVCSVAKPERGALVVANRGYRPVPLLLRCAGYSPKPGDTDQRPCAERWPGLQESIQ